MERTMKTLTDIKRRVRVGTVLECVAHTKRPELIGTVRNVIRTQGNAFVWKGPNDTGEKHGSWTYWPPAKCTEALGADTFRIRLVSVWGDLDPDHSVTLRFAS